MRDLIKTRRGVGRRYLTLVSVGALAALVLQAEPAWARHEGASWLCEMFPEHPRWCPEPAAEIDCDVAEAIYESLLHELASKRESYEANREELDSKKAKYRRALDDLFSEAGPVALLNAAIQTAQRVAEAHDSYLRREGRVPDHIKTIRKAATQAQRQYEQTGSAGQAAIAFLNDPDVAAAIERGRFYLGEPISGVGGGVPWIDVVDPLAKAIIDLATLVWEIQQYERNVEDALHDILKLLEKIDRLALQCEGLPGSAAAGGLRGRAEAPMPEGSDEAFGGESGDGGAKGATGGPVADPQEVEAAAQPLEELDGVLTRMGTRLGEEVLPPLSPFVFGVADELDPVVQAALIERAKPAIEAVKSDAARAVSLGRQTLAALARAFPQAGTAFHDTAVPALTAALSDPQAAVRRDALRALKDLAPADQRVVAAMAGRLRDQDDEVRLAAAEALGSARASTPVAARALLQAYRDARPGTALYDRARDALARLADTTDTRVQPRLPEGVSAPHDWFLVPSGAGPDHRLAGGRDGALDPASVPPGRYDLYWRAGPDHGAGPRKVVAAIEAAEGALSLIDRFSGVRLEVASWVPARHRYEGWWGVARSGDRPERLVEWTRQAEALLLPPGTYDVYWGQDAETRLHLAQGVRVEQGRFASVPANSGIRLALVPSAPRLPESGWWGAVAAGGPPEEPVHRTRNADVLLLPPGTYDVVWKRDSLRPAERIAQAVRVSGNQIVTVTYEAAK